MKKAFIKGVVGIIFLLGSVGLSGCSGLNPGNMTMPEESSETGIIITQEETSQSEMSDTELDLEYLDEVASIEIVDSYERKYEEELLIVLTGDEVSSLKEIKDKIKAEPQPWESNSVGYDGYKMNMYDKDGNLLTSWNYSFWPNKIVDTKGQFLDYDDALKEWIKEMEETEDVSFKLYARTPGENYFAELVNADHGNGEDCTDRAGDNEYIRFDLDEEDICTLQELTDTICIIEKSPMTIEEMDQEYDNLKYSFSVYTDTEASYEFYATDDGSVYIQTKYTFLVGGEGVEEWFRTLEAKYGLDQI